MDPRTKDWAHQFMEHRVDDSASLYMDAVQSLKEEHRSIYTVMHKKVPINLGYEENDALEEAFLLPGVNNKDDDKNDCYFGAPIPVVKTTDHRGIEEAFNVEADQVFQTWLCLPYVNWGDIWTLQIGGRVMGRTVLRGHDDGPENC